MLDFGIFVETRHIKWGINLLVAFSMCKLIELAKIVAEILTLVSIKIC